MKSGRARVPASFKPVWRVDRREHEGVEVAYLGPEVREGELDLRLRGIDSQLKTYCSREGPGANGGNNERSCAYCPQVL